MKNIRSKEIEYSTEYNTQFRAVSNTPIVTVEISPTGSGKTYYYKESANTIMLMPTNALVIQNGGIVSSEMAQRYEEDENTSYIPRTEWYEINKNICEYMTYDKFYGHISSRTPEDISSFNIIIDEAHNLIGSDNERHQELIMKLLERKVKYKELKLISATLRLEILGFYKHTIFDVRVYRKTDFNPHIHFVYQIPAINPTQRTLMFINSIDKMLLIEKHCKKKYKDIAVCIIRSGKPLPGEDELEKCQLILSTSVIKEGYSINCKIDKLIIHNKFNAEGAISILQYMARARNQTVETYVVMANTHFKSINFPKHLDELEMTEALLEYAETISNQSEFSNEVISLCTNNLVTKLDELEYFRNAPLSCYLYGKAIQNMELYYDNATIMKFSILVFIPSATIEVIEELELEEQEIVKFGRLDISDYLERLRTCVLAEEEQKQGVDKVIQEMIKKVDEIIKEIEDKSTDEIDETTKKRIIVKLEKVKKIVPAYKFTIDSTTYYYTNEILVEQILNESVFKRCKWHQHNIEKGVYEKLKDKIQSTRRLKLEDKLEVSKIYNKFKFIISNIKLSVKKFKSEDKNKESIKLLKRIYSFDVYDKDDVLIKANTTIKAESVIITSLYSVMESWYIIEK